MTWIGDKNEMGLERKKKFKTRLSFARKENEEESWKNSHDGQWAAYVVLKRHGAWMVFPVRELLGSGDEPDTVLVVMNTRKVQQVPKDAVLYDFVLALDEAQKRNIEEDRKLRGLTL